MFALKSSGDPEAYWPNSNFSRGTQSDGGLPRVEAGVAPARCAVAIKWHDPIGPIMLFSVPYCLVRLSRNSSNRSRRSSGSLSGHFRTHAPQSAESSFDHLVSELLEVRWHIDTDCRGSFDVDHEIEPLRTLYR